jgi:hypothetical protein
MPRLRVLTVVRALLVAVLAALIGLAPAAAATRSRVVPCWQELLAEWYGGSIRSIYPLPCYTQAIAQLPSGSLVFARATKDIRAAELAAEHGKPAPPERALPLPAGSRVRQSLRTNPNLLPCLVTRGQPCGAVRRVLHVSAAGGPARLPLWFWALAGCLLAVTVGVALRSRPGRLRS